MVSLVGELVNVLKTSDLNAKITYGVSPPTPDRCVTVFISPAGGFAPDNDMGATNPLIVFQCRDYSERDAEILAWRVHNLFNDRQMYYVGPVYVVQSEATLAPLRIGRDEGDRVLYSVNMRFKIDTPN